MKPEKKEQKKIKYLSSRKQCFDFHSKENDQSYVASLDVSRYALKLAPNFPEHQQTFQTEYLAENDTELKPKIESS